MTFRPQCAIASIVLLGAASLSAQRPVELVRTADGIRLDFRPTGVWRVKARAVGAARARLLSQRRFGELNAPTIGGASLLSVSGNFALPSILFAFNNTDTTQLPKAAQYDSIFYTTTPLSGRPYTVRTYYDELSNNTLHVVGQTFGWTQTDSASSYYLSACSPGGPIDCVTGRTRTRGLLVKALTTVDATVDFGAYDNDGPDGLPNSGDDDGVVDVVQFVQPVLGAECFGPGYGAFHYFLSGLGGGAFTTNDARFNGGSILVNEFQVISGVGGPSCGNNTQIAPVGTAAHETGHGFALPDLYDTRTSGEGLGEWSLMASGNYTSLVSPAHFDAWSKQQMGWVTVAPAAVTGDYGLGPVVSADTVFVVRPTGANPRGEYFLIENKQAEGSDAVNLNVGGQTGPKVGGLLVYHVDSQQIAQHGIFVDNAVNTAPINGVRLEEADGFAQLLAGANRGDAGDPFPGSQATTAFSASTNPGAVKNSDGNFVGFALDSIRQVVPGGAMAFRLRFGGVTLVRSSDSLGSVQVDGQPYTVFRDLLDDGSNHTVAIADTQLVQSGRRRLRFVSWSDGQAISHGITGALAGDTIVATVARDFLVSVTVGANGTVASNPNLNLAGTLVTEGTPVVLTATPTGAFTFAGWSGDTTFAGDTITLPLGRPYNLVATFAQALTITSAATRPNALMGAPIDDTLHASGGIGGYTWQIVAGALPPGLTLSSSGRITGIATALGPFNFSAQATSGQQVQTQAFSLSVVAPALVTADVVARLVHGIGTLTAAQLKYLDLIGNNNGIFDVGDFKAWVDATGAP